MKKLWSIIFWMITGAMLTEIPATAQQYDFIFNLSNVLDPTAEKYII